MFDMTAYPASPLNERPGRREKVALLGGITAQRVLAPWDDPAWDIWSMNLIPAVTPEGIFRADRWFELHERCAQTDDDLIWIRRCPVPIYVPDADMATLNSRALIYPLAQVERETRNYWACTMAYQIALALCEGYREVGLYGIDLRQGTLRERTVEWACLSWWAGFAEGRGMRITTPPRVWLGHHVFEARYGLDYAFEREAVAAYTENTVQVAFDAAFEQAREEPALPPVTPGVLRGFSSWIRGK
jgi:hypothetical protein